MIRSAVFASALLATTGAFAADLGVKKPSPVVPVASAACKETKALPADAFGFATGSDVSDLGAWGAAVDVAGSNGLRGGTAYAISPIAQVSGSFFPCFEVGPYLGFTYANFKAYNGGGTSRTEAFVGGLEMKYKLLGRAAHGIGLTLAVTPNFAFANYRPGSDDGSFYGGTFRLLADREILKDRLFGAFNLEFGNSVPGDGKNGTFGKSSFFNVRGALTSPVTSALYLGAEASYQSSYAGAWLNTYNGYGVYVGPTFFWSINDKLTLNGTWAYQVAGDSKGSLGSLGIDYLPRHQGRLKLAYAF